MGVGYLDFPPILSFNASKGLGFAVGPSDRGFSGTAWQAE